MLNAVIDNTSHTAIRTPITLFAKISISKFGADSMTYVNQNHSNRSSMINTQAS